MIERKAAYSLIFLDGTPVPSNRPPDLYDLLYFTFSYIISLMIHQLVTVIIMCQKMPKVQECQKIPENSGNVGKC